MGSKIMVSVNCITYNHENYIADAIESFLMQKTNFSIEILIHDDASTDNTANIIRKYQKKHPNIIKPIFQQENQYSKGVNVIDINLARAKGKYIASCEGDDFWINPNKLQKQFDFMQQHPECTLYAHSAHRVISKTQRYRKGIKLSSTNCYFTIDDVFKKIKGSIPTNSMFYPSKYARNRPAFFKTVVDRPLTIYLALNGPIYYENEFMSGYRVNVPNSWTNYFSKCISTQIEHLTTTINMMTEINSYTNFKYNHIIEEQILSLNSEISFRRKQNPLKREQIKTYLQLNTRQKCILLLKYFSPKLFILLQKLKQQTNNYPIKKITFPTE